MAVNVSSRRIPASFALTCRGALLVLVAAVSAVACASVPGPPPAAWSTGAVAAPVGPRGFVFARDTFTFPNEIRARHPDVEDLYANYCFVLARSLRQFFQFARFDPGSPKLDHAGYVQRVRDLTQHPP